MRRYAAIAIPRFAIQRIRQAQNLATDTPVALTCIQNNQLKIRQLSAGAEKAGVAEDMTASFAKALCPKLQMFPFEPLQDFKLLYKLAVALLDVAPFVAIDSNLVQLYKKNSLSYASDKDFSIIVDISGTERLYSSEKNLLRKIFAIFTERKLVSRIAISSTIGSAWAHAHYQNEVVENSKFFQLQEQKAVIIAPGSTPRDSLQKLPVAALRIPEATVTRLFELGLYSIASLNNYRPKELALRFGTQLVNRLNQACGHAEETLFFIHPKEFIATDLEFDPPLHSKQALNNALLKSITQTIEKLTKVQKRAARFVLTLQGIDPQQPAQQAAFCIRKEFSLQHGSTALAHITSIISPFLEGLSVPEGVTRLTLAAQTLQQLYAEQSNCTTARNITASQKVCDEFLNMMALQLGIANVCTLQLRESYIPEQSYSFIPLANCQQRLNRKAAHKQNLNGQQDRKPPPATAHSLLRYPTTIFKQAEKIQALSLLPDAPPTRITWRKQHVKLTRGYGPERVTNAWWQEVVKTMPEEREYFRVQDEAGRWLWLYRNRSSMEWYVQGMWC